MFQDHKLLMDRPVYDNVGLPLVIAGVPEKEIQKRVRAALDQVGLLGRERTRPIELSTGEQQRVGIARAIIAKPALLIADEPTGNLDPDLAIEVMNIFKRFNEVGVTVLIATPRRAPDRPLCRAPRDAGAGPRTRWRRGAVQPVASITATAPAATAASIGTAAPTTPLVLPDIKLD